MAPPEKSYGIADDPEEKDAKEERAGATPLGALQVDGS
jgi:hypothetical protein